MKEPSRKGPGPRELELQKMRLRGRAEKQARLEAATTAIRSIASDLVETGQRGKAKRLRAAATVISKPDVINELKLTMKRKVYVKRKKSIRPARRAKAPR